MTRGGHIRNELGKDIPKTNGEVIRSFIDEKLAKIGGICPIILSGTFYGTFEVYICRYAGRGTTDNLCYRCAVEWLKSEFCEERKEEGENGRDSEM